MYINKNTHYHVKNAGRTKELIYVRKNMRTMYGYISEKNICETHM